MVDTTLKFSYYLTSGGIGQRKSEPKMRISLIFFFFFFFFFLHASFMTETRTLIDRLQLGGGGGRVEQGDKSKVIDLGGYI